jgi:hypothetical protein
MWTTIGVPNETVVRDPRGRYTVDVADVPATPNDDWMPPMNTIKWRVEFYYTYAHSGVDFWDSEGKRWAKDAEHFTNPSGQLKNAVSQMVAPLTPMNRRLAKSMPR